MLAVALCALSVLAGCQKDSDLDASDMGGVEIEEPQGLPSDAAPSFDTAAVWYDVMSHGEYSVKEYVDSIFRVYPSLGNSPVASEAINSILMQLPDAIRIETYSFKYKSKDGAGREVTLSGALTVPTLSGKVLIGKNLILENRPTECNDENLPSNKFIIANLLCLGGNPLVVSDLLGYGASRDSIMSYCCQHIAAHNSVDAAMAAQCMLARETCGKLIKKPLPVINAGYSQGGYDALAVHKYMETEASAQEKELVDIKRSFCGAGPYDLAEFQKAAFGREAFLYAPFMLLSNISMLNYHANLLEGYKISDFMSEEAREAELVAMIESGNYGNNHIISWAAETVGPSPADVFSSDMADPESTLCKDLMKAVDCENLIKGWAPQKPLYFFHGTYDDCVPVECTKAAEAAFGNLANVSFEYDNTPYTEPGLHTTLAAVFYLKLFKLMAE